MPVLTLSMGIPGVFPNFVNVIVSSPCCWVLVFWVFVFVFSFLFCFCAYVTLLSTGLKMENMSRCTLHKAPISRLTVSGGPWSTAAPLQ